MSEEEAMGAAACMLQDLTIPQHDVEVSAENYGRYLAACELVGRDDLEKMEKGAGENALCAQGVLQSLFEHYAFYHNYRLLGVVNRVHQRMYNAPSWRVVWEYTYEQETDAQWARTEVVYMS